MQGDVVTGRQVSGGRLVPDSRVPNLRLGILRVGPEHIERYLPVDRNGLDAADDALARPFQHVR